MVYFVPLFFSGEKKHDCRFVSFRCRFDLTWWGISSRSTPHHRSRPRPYARPPELPPAAAPSHPSISRAAWLTAHRGGPTGLSQKCTKMARVKYRFGGWFFHETQGTWCGCNVAFFWGGEGNSCDTHCVCMSFVWLICFFKIGYINFKCQDCGTMNQEIQAYLCGIVVFNWLRPFILRPPLLHKVPGLTLDALDWEAHWWDLRCFIKKIRVEVGHYLNTPQSQ